MRAADAVMSPVVSVGYEGRDVDDLLAALRPHHVDALIDVRLTPLSRKPGLSKTALAAALGTHGIRYLHLRALGNPKDNRALLRTGDPSSRNRFTALLRAGDGAQALQHVAELLQTQTVALLCFEHNHEHCHRQLIVDQLRRVTPALHLLRV